MMYNIPFLTIFSRHASCMPMFCMNIVKYLMNMALHVSNYHVHLNTWTYWGPKKCAVNDQVKCIGNTWNDITL